MFFLNDDEDQCATRFSLLDVLSYQEIFIHSRSAFTAYTKESKTLKVGSAAADRNPDPAGRNTFKIVNR